MADTVALRTTLVREHLTHRHRLMGGVKRPFHQAAPLEVCTGALRNWPNHTSDAFMASCHRAAARRSARFVRGRCCWSCRQDGLGTEKRFDHEGSHAIRAAAADDDCGGCVLAPSRPLNAQPLAQLGFGSARGVVSFLIPAISAERRDRVAPTGCCMTIRKQPSGRFYAVLKSGRSYVTGRTFDTKRAAQAWLARERAALAGGVDPRAGRATVRTLLPVWLDERKHSVSAKTYTADAALPAWSRRR